MYHSKRVCHLLTYLESFENQIATLLLDYSHFASWCKTVTLVAALVLVLALSLLHCVSICHGLLCRTLGTALTKLEKAAAPVPTQYYFRVANKCSLEEFGKTSTSSGAKGHFTCLRACIMNSSITWTLQPEIPTGEEVLLPLNESGQNQCGPCGSAQVSISVCEEMLGNMWQREEKGSWLRPTSHK